MKESQYSDEEVKEIVHDVRREVERERERLAQEAQAVMYNELVRLGMPTGEGYSEKHFSNSYTK